MKVFMLMISFLLFPFILVSAFSSENFENANEFRGREFIVNPRIHFVQASKEILNDNNNINSFTNTQSQIQTKPFDVYSATLVISPINTQSYWTKNLMPLIIDEFLKKISEGKSRKEFEEESFPNFSEMELVKFPDQFDFFDPLHVAKFLHKKQDSIDIPKRMPEVLKITPSLKHWKEFLSPRQNFYAGPRDSISSILKQNIKRKHRKGKLTDSLKDYEFQKPVHKQSIQKNRESDDALHNFFPKEVIYKPLNTQYHEKMILGHPLKTVTEHFEEKLSDGKLILKKKHLNLNNNNRNFISNVHYPKTDFSKTRLSNLPVETVIRPLETEPKTKILERDMNIREINNKLIDSNGMSSHSFMNGLYPNIYGVSYSTLGKDFTSKKLQDDSKADDAPVKHISRNDKYEEEKKNFETEYSDSMKPFQLRKALQIRNDMF